MMEEENPLNNAKPVTSLYLNGPYLLIELPSSVEEDAEGEQVVANNEVTEPQPTVYVWTFERSDVVSGESMTVIVKAINWGEAIKKIQNEVRLPELDTAKGVREAFRLVHCIEDSIYWLAKD